MLLKHILPWGCLGLPGKPTVLQARVHLCPEMFLLLFVCSLAQELGNLGSSQSTCTCGHRQLQSIQCVWKVSAFWFYYGNKNSHQEFPMNSPKPESGVLSQALHSLYPSIHPSIFNLLHVHYNYPVNRVITMKLFWQDECCFQGLEFAPSNQKKNDLFGWDFLCLLCLQKWILNISTKALHFACYVHKSTLIVGAREAEIWK